MAAPSNFKDKDMQAIIGWVLRLGVMISMLIVYTGGVLYLCRHGHSIINYTVFNGVPDFVQPSHIFDSIWEQGGQAIIQAGIILLIATPVLRVIFSTIGFILERDHLYTVISIVVLVIIIISMLSGHAG